MQFPVIYTLQRKHQVTEQIYRVIRGLISLHLNSFEYKFFKENFFERIIILLDTDILTYFINVFFIY